MPDQVSLLVGGRVYEGWTDAGVTRAMDAAAGTFSLSVTDRWSPDSEPWEIVPGDECEIRIGDDTVVTGYVDISRPSFSATSHTISVQGRDKSADMIDCSAVHRPDEWKNISLVQLAEALAKPFGITVAAEVDTGAAFELIKLQHGETAMEALARYAKQRKVLVMPDGAGGILLTRTGRERAATALVQGQNILSASGALDFSDRFSEYTVKGQAGYSPRTDGKTESHITGKASDPGITRYRPLIVVADGESTAASVRERATWEANTRIGRAAQASITVQGWRQQEGGDLWRPNMLVPVTSSWLGINGEMLIRQVTFNKSASGTTTQLDLVSPQAYEAEPPEKPREKKKSRTGTGATGVWNESVGDDVRQWMERIQGGNSGQ